MDENDIFHEISKQISDVNSSLSKTTSFDKKEIILQTELGIKIPSTGIAYGEKTIPITDKFTRDCQKSINVCMDKNGASIIIDVPYIRRTYELFQNNSISYRNKF